MKQLCQIKKMQWQWQIAIKVIYVYRKIYFSGVFLSSTVQAPPSQPTAPSPEQTIPSQQSQSVPTSTAQQPSVQQQQQAPQTTTIHLNPLLGVAPLGPMPLSKEHYYQLSMLEAAFHHLPHPSDSERLRYVGCKIFNMILVPFLSIGQ